MKLGDRAELVQEIVEWLQKRDAQSAMDVDTAEMIHAIFSPYACQNARDEAYRDGQERGLKRLCRFVVGGFSKAYANLKPRGSFGSPTTSLVEKSCRPTANSEAGEHRNETR